MLQAAGNQPPNVLLLDAALPDTTGLEVLQTLRLQYSQVALPVIMLIARHNEKAIVQALDAGANDYAVKPFRSELLARIRMHLRSSSKAAAALMRAPSNSAEFSFLGDFEEERMSAELQRGMRLQELSSVPLLMIELDGVNEALSSATAEQASQLMGFIADCFDAMVEKYAVSKVRGAAAFEGWLGVLASSAGFE
jgi:DNA-binding response OmpR family regulator